MNLIICPKCNKIAAYNSYFNAYCCTNCGFLTRKKMKITQTNQWSYTQNEECWDNDWFTSKEEAIKAGREKYPGKSFEIGQQYNLEFTKDQCAWFDLAENAIDAMNDALEDEVGKVAEYWRNQITCEDEEDLNKRIGKAIMEWIQDRVGQPNVFLVDNIETIMEYDGYGCC